jgi:hypothetical protein
MNIRSLPVWALLSFEACFCLIILLKVVPATLKTGSVLAATGALIAATPWSLVFAMGVIGVRWAFTRRG